MLSRDGETDEYGFYKSSTGDMLLSDPIFPRQKVKPVVDKERRQELCAEWDDLLNEQRVTHITAANKQKVKELVRQGIPDSYRGIAWQVLLNSLNIYKTNEKNESTSKYCSFLGKPISEKTLIQIGKDIDRTQPLMKFFRSEH